MSCFPTSDDRFCKAAAAALAALDDRMRPGDVAGAIADLLRAAYPMVEVHRQDPLARISNFDLWYVYRDGRPTGRGLPEVDLEQTG